MPEDVGNHNTELMKTIEEAVELNPSHDDTDEDLPAFIPPNTLSPLKSEGAMGQAHGE